MLTKIIKLIKAIKNENMAKFMQWVLACMLLFLAIILFTFLVKESWKLATMLLMATSTTNAYMLIEEIVIWFLYFEFIALIAKYFESNLSFPLPYFIYIGITAIIRLIIVDHINPMATLLYSLAILVLLCALYVANSNPLRKIER